MVTVTYRAAMLDAETGSNETYKFEAAADLFSKPADDIVGSFIEHLNGASREANPLAYELNSAVKKSDKQVVMATGSLIRDKGEIPFLLMISPEARPGLLG
jgi:hypothetical protein